MSRHLYRLGVALGRFAAQERDAWRFDERRLDDGQLGHALGEVFSANSPTPEAFALATQGRSELYLASDEPLPSSQLRELFARLVGQVPHTFALEIERDDAVISRWLRAVAELAVEDGGDGRERHLDRALNRGCFGAGDSALRVLCLQAEQVDTNAGLEQRTRELVTAWRRRRRLGASTLVLAAHGAGDGSDANRAVEALAEKLAPRLLQAHVGTAFHKGQPGFEHVPSRSLVLPLLTSRGFFYQRLHRALGDGPVLLPPFGEDERTHALVEAELAVQLGDTPASETAVVVVGHGTRRSRRSGVATRALAERLRRARPGTIVAAAFLDQEPNLGTVARRLAVLRLTLAVVPFLLGRASHARDDINDAVTVARPARRLNLPPLLELPGVVDLLSTLAVAPALRSAA